MKKIFVTIMTLAATVFQMQAIEDASLSILLESDNNRSSVVTLNQAAIYTANEQNATEMLAQITNTTTAVNIYAIASYGNMSILGTNDLMGTYIGFTTNSRTSYTLTFGDVSGLQLYLVDYVENEITPITEGLIYPFTAPASSTINDRFQIARNIEVTTNAYGWASYSNDVDLALPAGLTAYKGAISGEELVLTSVADIAANQGVILYGTPSTTYYLVPTTATADFTGNDVKPSSAWTGAADGIYCLKGDALYQYTGTEMPANKAYIQIAGSGAPQRIRMVINGAQSVENVEAEVKAEKFVEDGQIFIRRGNEVYNLQGQKIVK